MLIALHMEIVDSVIIINIMEKISFYFKIQDVRFRIRFVEMGPDKYQDYF